MPALTRGTTSEEKALLAKPAVVGATPSRFLLVDAGMIPLSLITSERTSVRTFTNDSLTLEVGLHGLSPRT